MATIKSALAMYDGMTGPLKSIHNALNIVLNSFEAVQDASGNVINTSAIQDAREELARAEYTFDEIGQRIRGAEAQQRRFNESVRGGADAANELWQKLKGAAAAVGGMVGLKKMVELSDRLSGTTARLKNAQTAFASEISTTETYTTKNNVVNSVENTVSNLEHTSSDFASVVERTETIRRNSVETETAERTVQMNYAASGLPEAAAQAEQFSGLGENQAVQMEFSGAGWPEVQQQAERFNGMGADQTAQITFTDHNSIAELENKIMASAEHSRSAYFDTANAVAKMGLNARDAFSGMDEVIAFTELVNKSFVIGGAGAQEQSAAMLQLTQAMASGVLRGEELNSIFEQAPNIVQRIADYLDAPVGRIRAMASEGEITADVVKNAMFAAADDINKALSGMPKTWEQIWTSMQNKALSIFTPILNRINEIGGSARFQTVTDGILNGLAGVAQIATVVLDTLIAAASVVVDNWSWLGPVIMGVAGAYFVLHGAMAVYNAVQAITNGLQAIAAASSAMKAGASIAEAAAATTATGAQVGLNAALYACPIMWVVMLVIALIAVFYAAVAAVNHFAGTSVSATGIICGAFMTALAFIGNIFVALWNIVVDVFVLIYNLVADVANFIGNVFNDPVGAVARLFFDLADTVLGVLQSLASAIDAIFGSNLSGAVQGWRNSLGSWVDSTFGQGETIMERMSGGELKLGRFEYGEAFDLGYKFGEGIEDTVGGLFKTPGLDGMGLDSLDAFNLGNSLDGIYGNTGDTAANTAAAADTLDYMDEDLAWMKDIAEREAINRYTTAQITVEQHNENHIARDTDLDGIMEAFCSDFAEKLDISAEGVHT